MKRTITIDYILENNIGDLEKLGQDFMSDINYFYSRFSGIKHINDLNFRKIRDEILKELEHLNLSGHYLQRCLNTALGNIKSMWSNTFRFVKSNISSNKNLTKEEKHFLLIVIKIKSFVDYIVNTNKSFDELLESKYFSNWKKENPGYIIDERKIRQYLKRQIRKLKPKIPYTKKKYFKIDRTLYNFKEDKFYMANSYKKGERFELVSVNKNTYSSEATVHFNGDKVKIGFPIDVKQKKLNRDNANEIGIDKGFIALITTSNKTVYGQRFCDIIKPYIDKYLETQKERGKYWSLYRKYKNTNSKKAENIKKNNLGYVKFNKNKNITKEAKKKIINHSINEFIKTEKPTEIIVEDLSWDKKSNKKRYRLGYDLSSWDKGYLQERIEFKAYENSITVTKVNPAYTSQICSCCGKLGERNGKQFKCDSCGIVLDADYNASINIKNRKASSITTYMKPSEVLEKLGLV